ncbi:MAG TPA: hypothetical protein VFU89_07745, partial [Rhabdochlamydiaceae bacterium]|nr:hypothetical protein [Rhabdochlamydiaceae bacterium]
MTLQVYTAQIKEACYTAINFSQSLLYGKSGIYRIGTISVKFEKRLCGAILWGGEFFHFDLRESSRGSSIKKEAVLIILPSF